MSDVMTSPFVVLDQLDRRVKMPFRIVSTPLTGVGRFDAGLPSASGVTIDLDRELVPDWASEGVFTTYSFTGAKAVGVSPESLIQSVTIEGGTLSNAYSFSLADTAGPVRRVEAVVPRAVGDDSLVIYSEPVHLPTLQRIRRIQKR